MRQSGFLFKEEQKMKKLLFLTISLTAIFINLNIAQAGRPYPTPLEHQEEMMPALRDEKFKPVAEAISEEEKEKTTADLNAESSNNLLGDLNGDAVVDISDVILVQRQVLGLDPLTENADINQDGVVDKNDTENTQRIALGFEVLVERQPSEYGVVAPVIGDSNFGGPSIETQKQLTENRPLGWDKGEKTGWGKGDVPPGLAKKNQEPAPSQDKLPDIMPQYTPGEIIVKIKPGTSQKAIDHLLKSIKGTLIGTLGDNLLHIKVGVGKEERILKRLNHRIRIVEYAELNYMLTKTKVSFGD